MENRTETHTLASGEVFRERPCSRRTWKGARNIESGRKWVRNNSEEAGNCRS